MHGVRLDAQVEEKSQDVDVLRQVVPGSAGRHDGGLEDLAVLALREPRVQGVLVELGQLLQGDGYREGWGLRKGERL